MRRVVGDSLIDLPAGERSQWKRVFDEVGAGRRVMAGGIAWKGIVMKQEASAAKLASAVAFEACELVSYAPDSIVSRTIAENAAGTITMFAFDAGQGLSEHSAPYDAIVHVLDGAAQVVIGGKPVDAPAGRIVVMPAGTPHSVKAVQRFKMLLIMLRATRS